jgi:hypothetical protein
VLLSCRQCLFTRNLPRLGAPRLFRLVPRLAHFGRSTLYIDCESKEAWNRSSEVEYECEIVRVIGTAGLLAHLYFLVTFSEFAKIF